MLASLESFLFQCYLLLCISFCDLTPNLHVCIWLEQLLYNSFGVCLLISSGIYLCLSSSIQKAVVLSKQLFQKFQAFRYYLLTFYFDILVVSVVYNLGTVQNDTIFVLYKFIYQIVYMIAMYNLFSCFAFFLTKLTHKPRNYTQ